MPILFGWSKLYKDMYEKSLKKREKLPAQVLILENLLQLVSKFGFLAALPCSI